MVLKESEKQLVDAQQVLNETEPDLLRIIINHSICIQLLYKQARFVTHLASTGILKEREGQVFLEQITREINQTEACVPSQHTLHKLVDRI